MARTKVVNGIRIELTDAELRGDRNRRLSSTDFYALSDVTMSQAMTDYRQALRDLPSGLTTEAEVNAVSWPVAP